MNNPYFTAGIILHLLLVGFLWLMQKHSRKLSAGCFLFCLLLPIFGPCCGFEMVLMPEPDPDLLKDLIHDPNAGRKGFLSPEQEAAVTAPLEEAFLISTPQVRREMMMKLLHDDPSQNLELLMMARFNDDPETAHYATATLTEYQRKLELSLQESQSVLLKQPDNQEQRILVIQQIKGYIDSGLLEGHLLERYRLSLEKELSKLPEGMLDMKLGCLRAKNLLAIRKAPEAIALAKQLTDRYPGAEEPWLMLLEIYVDLQDAKGLLKTLDGIRVANVLWSYHGHEKIDYFLKGRSA